MAEKMTSKNPEETKKLAGKLVRGFRTGTLIVLKGELGAGKTTFAQGLGETLGINRMTSPTYTLIREYQVDGKIWPFERLYHIDLYRLNSATEAMELGLNEIWFNPKNLVLIEWPEKIESYLPTPRTEVILDKKSDESRLITIQ